MIFLILLAVTSYTNFHLAKSYGRNVILWGFSGLFLPILSNIFLLFMGVNNKNKNVPNASVYKEKENLTYKEEIIIKKAKDIIKPKSNSIMISGKRKPLFIDVETTGLHSNDSIVSLCMILLYCDKTEENKKLTYKKIHYIFDPCKKSHPIAEKIHGYDDWTLRHQNLFIEKIKDIQSLINECDLIVAHNIKFDISFMRREFHKCGIEFPNIDTLCTMEETIGRSSLQACAEKIGLHRNNEIHDAGEDTKIMMCVYLSRRSNIKVKEFFPQLLTPIENFISPPPRPNGPLPRRNNIQKKASVMAKISQMQPEVGS